jgi:hypothetical protein
MMSAAALGTLAGVGRAGVMATSVMFQILALCCLDGGPVTSMSLAIVVLTAEEALSQTQFVRLGRML